MAQKKAPATTSTRKKSNGNHRHAGSPPTVEQIARRAYELYESRGRINGADLEDWLRAEQELQHPKSAA